MRQQIYVLREMLLAEAVRSATGILFILFGERKLRFAMIKYAQFPSQ